MFCSDCGGVVRDSARFCASCGVQVAQAAPAGNGRGSSGTLSLGAAAVSVVGFGSGHPPVMRPQGMALAKTGGALILAAGLLRMAPLVQFMSTWITDQSLVKYFVPQILGAVGLIGIGFTVMIRGGAVWCLVTCVLFMSLALVETLVTLPSPNPLWAFNGLRLVGYLDQVRPFDIATTLFSFVVLFGSLIVSIISVSQERHS